MSMLQRMNATMKSFCQ